MANLPPCPPQLKAIQHYIKTATEHEKRDPIVTYYCRLYTLQQAMIIDKTSPECRQFLVALMDHLEQLKKSLLTEEAVQSEVVGQAHMEHYALKVFLFADNEDRAGRFSKNVVKSFYTAGMLFDVLSTFGDLSEDLEKTKKYAKWKAAYIHRCLKNGETPVAGPLPEEEGGEDPGYTAGYSSTNFPSTTDFPGAAGYDQGAASTFPPQLPQSSPGSNIGFSDTTNVSPPAPATQKPSPKPRQPATYTNIPTQPVDSSSLPSLDPNQYQKAGKYCKYASSALQYEDSKTAVENLQKALKLLTTGQENN